jgi:hypothetical protein
VRRGRRKGGRDRGKGWREREITEREREKERLHHTGIHVHMERWIIP